MGKRKYARRKAKIARREAKSLEAQRKYIADLEKRLLPGQHLLTCPYCYQIVKLPIWVINVTCMHYGLGGSPHHPEALKW